MGTARRALLAALAGALLAGPAAAQVCGIRTGGAIAGGWVSHRVAGGTSGAQVGFDVDLAGPVGIRLEYRSMFLEDDAPDPIVGRVRAGVPLATVGPVAACADLHGGISRFTFDDDTGLVLAGGLGLRVQPAEGGTFRPWIAVRGLGGWMTGTVLNVDVSTTALSLGVEGGVAVLLGTVSLRVSGSRDGFDNGMGATPYPETSFEAALSYHF